MYLYWSSPNPKSSSRKNRYLCEAEYKRRFSCNTEAQTDKIAYQKLGSPKGQLRVTEGAGGHGLPARALQAADSHRDSSKPEAPEVLTRCATDDILLPRCRNTEGPLGWNPSDLVVTRPQGTTSFCGVGVGRTRSRAVVLSAVVSRVFSCCLPPCREPKGPCSKHRCTTSSGVCRAGHTA